MKGPQPISAALSAALPPFEPGKVIERRCRCGEIVKPYTIRVERDGFPDTMRTMRDTCEACARDAAGRAKLARIEAQLSQIPALFRWVDLSKPIIPPRGVSAVVSAVAVKAVRDWSGRLLLIRGPTGSGKTVLAAGRYRIEVERGIGRAAFVCCDDLSPDAKDPGRALSAALSADLTVLDDLGADLSNAPAGGGLAAWRGEKVRRVIRERHNANKRTIVTFSLEDAAIGEAYGGDIERRLTEEVPGSVVLRLKGRT